MQNENTTSTQVYNFLIGSNNQTKKREFKKAMEILNRNRVKGFTIFKDCLGIWENEQERSFNIQIISNEYNPFNDSKARILKHDLEQGLKQFLVLVTRTAQQILN